MALFLQPSGRRSNIRELAVIERRGLVLKLRRHAPQLAGALTVSGDMSVARVNASELDEVLVDSPHAPNMARLR